MHFCCTVYRFAVRHPRSMPVQYAYVHLSASVPQITHPLCYTCSLTSTTIAIIGIKCCMHHWYICIFVQKKCPFTLKKHRFICLYPLQNIVVRERGVLVSLSPSLCPFVRLSINLSVDLWTDPYPLCNFHNTDHNNFIFGMEIALKISYCTSLHMCLMI